LIINIAIGDILNHIDSQPCSIGQKWLYLLQKYLNGGMDSHRLTCEVVQLVNDLPKNWQKFEKPFELHVKGFNWSMTFSKKFQNFLKT
jgi:hypothetical protein